MGEQAARPRMTYAEYLVAEEIADTKHEYLRGEVYAMAGGTAEHARLAASVMRYLGNALDGGPCRVYTSDLRVRIEETDRATYPDVTVICGEVEYSPLDPRGAVNPTLIVEVLSDSTEADDRGEKFAHYRRIPSLREYVLVSQRARRIEVYRRGAATWQLAEAGPGASVELASIGASLDVDAMYG